MDQSTFVTRVAARLNIDSSDPMYPFLDEYVNEGLHYLETASPEGFPWMTQTVTLTTVANDRDYTFAALGLLTSNSASVTRVKDCSILYMGTQWVALDLINPESADLEYGDSRGSLPQAWFAEGQTLYLYPTPDAAYSVRVRCVTVEPDLGGAASTPVLPVVFHQAVIDAALLVCYQQLQDSSRMETTQGKVDQWVDRMKRYGAEYANAPRVTVRDPLN